MKKNNIFDFFKVEKILTTKRFIRIGTFQYVIFKEAYRKKFAL